MLFIMSQLTAIMQNRKYLQLCDEFTSWVKRKKEETCSTELRALFVNKAEDKLDVGGKHDRGSDNAKSNNYYNQHSRTLQTFFKCFY